MRISLLVLILMWAAGCSSIPRPSPTAIPTPLEREIRQADQSLFDALFETCDANALAELITEDFEFLHDKGGLVARSRSEFTDRIRASCAAQALGREPRTRRELIVETFEVHPIADIGAVETGRHRFFHRHPGHADEPTEEARFTNYWRREAGRWRLARVLSYDHRPLKH